MIRRLTVIIMMFAACIGAVVLPNNSATGRPQIFSAARRLGTPSIHQDEGVITRTWLCAGSAASGPSGDGEYGGEVVLTNPTDAPITGVVTILTSEQDPLRKQIAVEARSQLTVDIGALVTARYASAYVELSDSSASVEQRAIHPAGVAVSPCANSTSSEWYFADGFTAAASEFRILLTNPYLTPAILNIGVSTEKGFRSPQNLDGYVIPPQSMRVLNIADAGFRDEKILAISVTATAGQIVAAKEQHFLGAGRLGYVLALGSPSMSDQWWFADGEKGMGMTETFKIFNPSEEQVSANVLIVGLKDTVAPPATSLTIPAHDVVAFNTAALVGMPEGLHGAVITSQSGANLVVERILTRPAATSVVTSVVLGGQKGTRSLRWSIPTSTRIALKDALIVLNTSSVDALVTVFSVGPGGEEPVPGLIDIPLAANDIISIDLIDDLALGRALEVVGSQTLMVERRLERTPTLRGRSGSLAIPG
ncbi:MAG: DUF5719 family protein [Actinomycetes bacterium]